MGSYSDDDKELAIPIPKTDLGRAKSMIYKAQHIIASHVHFDGQTRSFYDLESKLSWERQSTTIANKINDAITAHVPDIDGVEISNNIGDSQSKDTIECEKHKTELEFLNKEVKKINPKFSVAHLSKDAYRLEYKNRDVCHFEEWNGFWCVTATSRTPTTHLAFKNLQSVLLYIDGLNQIAQKIMQK